MHRLTTIGMLALLGGVVLGAQATTRTPAPPTPPSFRAAPVAASPTVSLTEVESLRLQALTQQRTILQQQQQLLQQQFQQIQDALAKLTTQAKGEFEGVAKAHQLNLVFDPQTFQLVAPAPAPPAKGK